MGINGFYISRLVVAGTNIKPASLTFEPGFNVISGLSNTGKSFISICINYMLGGEEPPKSFKLSNGYTNVYLEIKTFNGKTFTLRRSILGGKFLLKETEVGKFKDTKQEIELYEKNSETNENNISSFLLDLCGFEKKMLSTNKENAKRPLSYRDIANLTLIDESKIVVERSPVYSSGQYTNQPVEQSVLKLLLTGIDASLLDEIENKKVYAGRLKGKLELIDDYLEKNRAKLANLNSREKQETFRLSDEKLRELTTTLLDTSKELETLQHNKQVLFNQTTALRSAELLQEEIDQRFILLGEHYQSDLNRLDFILEGDFLLGQLNTVDCPVCGSLLDQSHYDCLNEVVSNDVNIINSINSERTKIRQKKLDLDATRESNKKESQLRKSKIAEHITDLQHIEALITNNLTPKKATTKGEIEEILLHKAKQNEAILIESQIKEYLAQKAIIETELKNKPKTSIYSESTVIDKIQDLCNEIALILKQWQFEKEVNITFDQAYRIYDIIINGEARKSNGKGVRAVTYSAVILGIMQYCINNNMPHPRHIILDSPLTTYHGIDAIETEDDAIPFGLQNAFFEHLASLPKDRQVIIFDNKIPEEAIISKINYVYFTKNKQSGRPGFLPLPDIN